MDACLEPDRVSAFVRGAGAAAEREAVEAHIDECDACRRLVAAAAAAEHGGAEGAGEVDLAGTVLGRYTLGERLGAGGMGVVYRAEDTQLRRRVVIKLHRADAGAAADAHGRLLREAQAMAQLSHANVVTVYDIGSFDDSVYLAMEYLDGGDLRAWLAARPRTPREIVDVFVQAARGLAAAHAAGIVHRDFKPTNVVVGADGRVKVTDFGIARAPAVAELAASGAPASGPVAVGALLASSSITRTGVAVGTPAYMAPEQAAGEAVDARSDQYSFCVALYEALEGTRPAPIDAAGARMTAPARPMPPGVWPALRRGLSARPADRFPSMGALIDALGSDRPLRTIVIASVVVAAAITAAVVWYAFRDRGAAVDPCVEPAAEGVRTLWTAERKAGIATALGNEAVAAIDGLATRWQAMRRDTCAATEVRHVQPPDVRDLRMACLDRRRRELAALIARAAKMRRADAATVPALVGVVDQLWLCTDEATLAAEPHAPAAELDGRLLGLHERLLRPDDVQSARDNVTLTHELRYAPATAEALIHLGEAQLRAKAAGDAATSFEQAVREALTANAVELRAVALVGLVRAKRALGEKPEVDRWAALAALAIRRQAGPRPLAAELATEAGATRDACAPPADQRVHLAFDDGSGDRASDTSGQGNDGKVVGTDDATWVAGRIGGGLDFDGYNDAVDAGSAPSVDDLPAISMCAWIWPRTYPSRYPAIADKSGDTFEGGWNFYIQTDGTIGFLSGFRDWAETGLIQLATWQHVCATWDGALGPEAISIYQNGALVPGGDRGTNREGKDLDPRTAHRDSDAQHHLLIGRVNNGEYGFDGKIDDYQLYARALSWTEIMALYDCALLRD